MLSSIFDESVCICKLTLVRACRKYYGLPINIIVLLHQIYATAARSATEVLSMTASAGSGLTQSGIFEDLQHKIDEDTAVKDVCSALLLFSARTH